MYKTKRIISLCLVALMLLTVLPLIASADGEDGWIYIDGTNITRVADTAVIYKGIASTGQTQWGHDVVVDSEGVVTNIIEGGLSEGENLKIPENHFVVSAAGNKVQWFKTNVKKGAKLFFDSYTNRLFVLDNKDKFDPYFSVEKEVTGEKNFIIKNSEVSGTPAYTYDVAVDKDGVITSRGSNAVANENGFTISAATKADKEFLMIYAILGAKCEVKDGIATFSYDKTMLQTTLDFEIKRSENILKTAKESFYDFDIEKAEKALKDVKESKEKLDYQVLVSLLSKLESDVNTVCSDVDSNEVRAAFHTPNETDKNAVRETVKKAKENGLNTLFLRVSNGYGTFIPLPEDNKFKQDASFGGFDLLKAYIDVCEEENIALGLSVDVYYNEYASIAANEWTTVTNGTEKGISEKYYSPASVGFKEYFTDYIKFIVGKYDISTVLLDYLRYPKFHENCDLGYDYDTIANFAKEYSVPLAEAEAIKTELFESKHWQKWVEYRMGLVTDMAKAIRESVDSVRTDVNLIAIAARDSVDHFYMQDTVQWLEDGIIDGITLSLYERNPAENDVIDVLAYDDKLVADKGQLIGSYTNKNAFFFTALEVSKALNADTIETMINESRSVGADGFIFGSLNDYIAQNYYLSLSNDAMKGEAFSPIGNPTAMMKNTLAYSKTKINDVVFANGGCDESSLTQAITKIDEALKLLDKDVLNFEQANTLESDIALIFASSNAKQTVLKEFSAITKTAKLYKTKEEIIPPEVSEDESSNVDTDDESSEAVSDVSEDTSSGSQIVNEKKKLDINIGNILIYLFVGATTIVAVAAIIIVSKRKNKAPVNRHMRKNDENEDKEE
ncbi:MAG: family 10 glycosylhydrolase [Clostridia bacterium]|nr:family 10 glycosylhydrolase [Clostridia bacterium]